jgi:MarR family transcriptional regulator, organic hydroperoxide resistance regulator
MPASTKRQTTATAATKAGASSARKTSKLTVSRPELLVDGSDTTFRALVHDMLGFSARIQDIRNKFGRLLDLSGTSYTILMSIAHLQHGEAGINAIADHLHFSGAFITTEVNKLVKAGLVAKVTNPEDRRRVRLTLTPEARTQLDALTGIQSPVNDMLFPLSAEEFQMLGQIMSKLVLSSDQALHLVDYLSLQAKVAEG